MPKISIITPCYNAERFIERTIESVSAQTLADWEMVVVDDGSADNTAQIVGRYAACEPRLRLIRQERGGVCRARNAGFHASSSESDYLLFLDQDDCVKPEMLATMAQYLDEHKEVGLAHCDFEIIGENDLPAHDPRDFARYVFDGKRLSALPAEIAATPFEAIFWNCPILPSASMIRRSVYEQTLGWDEMFGHGNEDVDLFLQLCLIAPVHYVAQPLARYRVHSGQASRRVMQQHRQQMRLYTKWLARSGPAGDRLSWLLATWRLYEGRLVPRLWLSRAARNLCKRDIAETLRCLMRCVKHFFLARSLPARQPRASSLP